MLEFNKEFATIMAFDVKVEREAAELAEKEGVRIFQADIIYHLFDKFTAYLKDLHEAKKAEAAAKVVFPVVLKVLEDSVIHKKSPMILGVDVMEGVLKVGTPICVPGKDFVTLGRVGSIEYEKREATSAKPGQQVAIRITPMSFQQQGYTYGRQFDYKDELVSKVRVDIAPPQRTGDSRPPPKRRPRPPSPRGRAQPLPALSSPLLSSLRQTLNPWPSSGSCFCSHQITRESIDLLKEYHKEDMKPDDWRLIIRLKKLFGIY